MVNPSTVPDFVSLTEVVPLSDTAIDWAIHQGQTMTASDEQWPCYLRSLAVMGVKQWLEDGVTPYAIHLDEQQPPAPLPALQVNGIQVGVVPVGSLPPTAVYLSRTRVDAPQPTHLWVLVEVQEELGQVRVVQALEGRQVAPQATAMTPAGEYELPLTAFTVPPEQALLYLNYPAAIATPAPASTTQAVMEALGSGVINVGRWLQDQLDEVAQQLAWTLLDPVTPAMALRSPTQELETILAEIEPQGVTIPDRARAAYTEIQVAGVPLRLYALIWTVFERSTPEWSLFVFLGPSPGSELPPGLALRIRDADTVLTEQTFSAGSAMTFLYAQVFGTWDESFTLDIVPPEGGTPVTLPTFRFQPTS